MNDLNNISNLLEDKNLIYSLKDRVKNEINSGEYKK